MASSSLINAPGFSQATVVSYQGKPPNYSLPPTLAYHLATLVQEKQYQSYAMTDISPTESADETVMEIYINQQQTFWRGRSMMMYSTYVETNSGASAWQGASSLTPLPGMPILAWDQIVMQVGSNKTNIMVNTQNSPVINYMYQSCFEKRNKMTANVWDVLSGYDLPLSWDYAGGILNSGGKYAAPAQATNQVVPVFNNSINPIGLKKFTPTGVQADFTLNSEITQVFPQAIPAWWTMNETAPVIANYPFFNRTEEPGPWYDERLQKMRCCFKGNNNCTTSTYLTHFGSIAGLSMFKEIFDYPPTEIKWKFVVQEKTRPKYVYHPMLRTQDANGLITMPTNVIPENFNYKVVKNQCKIYYQQIFLRFDIQYSTIESWTQSGSFGGITLPIIQLSYMPFVQVTPSQNHNVVSTRSNIPILFYMGSKPTSFQPMTGLPSSTTYPPSNTLLTDFAFGSNLLKSVTMVVTTPQSTSLILSNDNITPQTCPTDITTQVSRGIYDAAFSYYRQFQNTAGMYNVDLEDTDKYNPLDAWYTSSNTAVGTQLSLTPANTTTTVYGSHALTMQTPKGKIMLNCPPHNNFVTLNMQSAGVYDAMADYGIWTGSATGTVNFSELPCSQTVHFLLISKNNMMFSGDRCVTTSMQAAPAA
jgi:hypothetical protein